MDIKVQHCLRQSECTEKCGKKINLGEPMVRESYWYKVSEDNHKLFINRYHIDCWIQKQLMTLKLNPFIPNHNRGRKSIQGLTGEQAKLRLKLLRDKASLEQRKKNLNTENPEYWNHMSDLDNQIYALYIRISQVGGIPMSWLRDLVGV